MQCPKCGTNNGTEAKFCSACGNSLPEPQSTPASSPTSPFASLSREALAPATSAKGANGTVILACLMAAALVLAIGGGGYWYYQRNTQVENPDLKVGDRWVYMSNNHSIESNPNTK